MKKRVFHIVCSLGMTCLLLLTVFSEQTAGQFLIILEQISREEFLLYLALSMGGIIFRALRYRLVLVEMESGEAEKEGKKIPLKDFFIVTTVRNALVDSLPARLGELSFFYIFSRFGISIPRTVSTFGVCLLLDIFVLALLFGVLALGAPMLSMSLTERLWFIPLLFVFIGAGYILFRNASRLFYFVSKNLQARLAGQKLLSHLKLRRWGVYLASASLRMGEDLESLQGRRLIFQMFFLTLCLRIAKYGSLLCLLFAVISQWDIGVSEVGFFLPFVAFVIAEAAASLPVSGILGFGAYELSWAGVLGAGGITLPSATAVIFAIHVMTQIVGYSFGFLGLLALFVHEFTSRK